MKQGNENTKLKKERKKEVQIWRTTKRKKEGKKKRKKMKNFTTLKGAHQSLLSFLKFQTSIKQCDSGKNCVIKKITTLTIIDIQHVDMSGMFTRVNLDYFLILWVIVSPIGKVAIIKRDLPRLNCHSLAAGFKCT